MNGFSLLFDIFMNGHGNSPTMPLTVGCLVFVKVTIEKLGPCPATDDRGLGQTAGEFLGWIATRHQSHGWCGV